MSPMRGGSPIPRGGRCSDPLSRRTTTSSNKARPPPRNPPNRDQKTTPITEHDTTTLLSHCYHPMLPSTVTKPVTNPRNQESVDPRETEELFGRVSDLENRPE